MKQKTPKRSNTKLYEKLSFESKLIKLEHIKSDP